MKIGIDANSLTRNFKDGTGRYTEELFKAISKIDKKNEYIFFASKKIKIPKQKNFRQVLIPGFPFLKRQFFLPIYVRKENLDIFHHMDPYGSMFLKHPKTITTVHDIDLKKTYPIFRNIKYFIKRYYSKVARLFVLNNSMALLFDSKSILNDIKKTFPSFLINKNIELTPLSHSDFFKPSISKKHANYFLCMGDFSIRKNVTAVFRSYSLLEKKYKNKHKLVLVTSKPEQKRFKDLAKNYSISKYLKVFIGPDDKTLRSLYQSAICFIYPSIYEGFGLPILEAMACGCPVITSNYGAMKEVSGNAALLVDPKSILEVSKNMVKLATDMKFRTSVINRGFKQIKKFNWSKTANKTLDVYNKI